MKFTPLKVKQWKEKLEHDTGQIFTDPNRHKDEDKDKLIQDLYKQVGKLSVQNDWLKKAGPRRRLICLLTKLC